MTQSTIELVVGFGTYALCVWAAATWAFAQKFAYKIDESIKEIRDA